MVVFRLSPLNEMISALDVGLSELGIFRFRIETHSLPTLARRLPRGFTFYVAQPIHSIRTS
jgi:hypothetical protein